MRSCDGATPITPTKGSAGMRMPSSRPEVALPSCSPQVTR